MTALSALENLTLRSLEPFPFRDIAALGKYVAGRPKARACSNELFLASIVFFF
jgi:hypothetical protein